MLCLFFIWWFVELLFSVSLLNACYVNVHIYIICTQWGFAKRDVGKISQALNQRSVFFVFFNRKVVRNAPTWVTSLNMYCYVFEFKQRWRKIHPVSIRLLTFHNQSESSWHITYRGIPLLKSQYHTSGLMILMNNKFVTYPVMQVSQLDKWIFLRNIENWSCVTPTQRKRKPQVERSHINNRVL